MVLMMRRRPKEVPVDPGTGERYRFEMVHDGGRVTYAESYVELCEVLVGYDTDQVRQDFIAGGTPRFGYDASVAEELESAVTVEVTKRRILYALGRAVWLQALVNVGHPEEIEAMDEVSRRAVSGSRYPQPSIVEWPHAVPLVLSRHDYAPYGDKPRPVGENIWWINPFTERSLIQSLHRIGDIEVSYRTRPPSAGPKVESRSVDQMPAAGGPVVVTSGDAANRLVASMRADGADFVSIMLALDAADHVAVLLDADAMARDDTRRLVGWLQAGDLSIEQFITALANAGIPATTTGSYPDWPARRVV